MPRGAGARALSDQTNAGRTRRGGARGHGRDVLNAAGAPRRALSAASRRVAPERRATGVRGSGLPSGVAGARREKDVENAPPCRTEEAPACASARCRRAMCGPSRNLRRAGLSRRASSASCDSRARRSAALNSSTLPGTSTPAPGW
jgi:hypothetical protein